MRLSPNAAAVPTPVDTNPTIPATSRLFWSALRKGAQAKRSRYQRQLRRPSGKPIMALLPNENRITRRIGVRMNTTRATDQSRRTSTVLYQRGRKRVMDHRRTESTRPLVTSVEVARAAPSGQLKL